MFSVFPTMNRNCFFLIEGKITLKWDTETTIILCLENDQSNEKKTDWCHRKSI